MSEGRVLERSERNLVSKRWRIENAGNMRIKISEICDFVGI
jgi:hypothetical protein